MLSKGGSISKRRVSSVSAGSEGENVSKKELLLEM